MDTCDFCRDSTDHAFRCSYCDQALCGTHRLPENHECPAHSHGAGGDGLGGSGPSTSDRRGTGRKRRERVAENRTSRKNPPPEARQPQSKGDFRSDTVQDEDVLTCPTCQRRTERVIECDQCGQSVCPECVGVYEHECPVGVQKEGAANSGKSLFSRLIDFFR